MGAAVVLVLAISIGPGVGHAGPAAPSFAAAAPPERAPVVLVQRKASVHRGVRDSKRHWNKQITGSSGGRYNPPEVPGTLGSPNPTPVAPPPRFRAAVPERHKLGREEEERSWWQWLLGL